jgi:hypothetical protein
MFRRSPLTALLAASIGLVLVAQPAFALSWNDGAFTGKVGAFAGPARAEVVCRYNAAGRLRSVNVRPLTMWGSYRKMTVVGWRYQLREAEEFQAGRLVYRSRVWKDLASNTIAADELKSHRFYVREDVPGTSAYYVSPVLFWYARDSATLVEGRARVLYDAYLLKRGTESRWSNACVFDYNVAYWGQNGA